MYPSVPEVEKEASERLANVKTPAELESFRIDYLGKKGRINRLMERLKVLSSDERKSFGVEVNRLKAREIPQATPATQAGKALGTPVAPAPAPVREGTAKVSCSQVWKLLGQGADETTAAQSLGTTEAVVRACEQEIGRGKRRR